MDNRKQHTETYTLRTLERSETAPKVILTTTDAKSGMYSFVVNAAGEYVLRKGNPSQAEEELFVKLTLDMPTDAKGNRYIWEKKLVVATDAYLLELGIDKDPEGMSAQDYKNNAQVIELLKGHRQVIWKNNTPNNINLNIKSDIVTFELINSTEALRTKSTIEEKVLDALYEVKKWRTEDPKRYYNFCTLWGIDDVSRFSKEELSNIIKLGIEGNYAKFDTLSKLLDDEITVGVHKAKFTNLPNSEEKVINFKDNVFYFNGKIVSTTIEEAVTYFKTHPKDYEILKTFLGIKEETISEAFETPRVKTEPNVNNMTIMPELQTREKEKFLGKIETKLLQIKNGKNVMADKVKNAYPPIDGVLVTVQDVLSQYALTETVVKYSLQKEYWQMAFDMGLTEINQAI